ncbi:MAG: tetratricopeptide repeat protein [Candidatus Hodarchaeota archaeon]
MRRKSSSRWRVVFQDRQLVAGVEPIIQLTDALTLGKDLGLSDDELKVEESLITLFFEKLKTRRYSLGRLDQVTSPGGKRPDQKPLILIMARKKGLTANYLLHYVREESQFRILAVGPTKFQTLVREDPSELSNMFYSLSSEEWQRIFLAMRNRVVYQELENLLQDNKATEQLIEAGCTFYETGDLLQASQHFEQARTLCKKTGNKRLEGSVLNNFGLLEARRGDYQKAIEYYQDAQEIQQNYRWKEIIITHNNLGAAYERLSEFTKALGHYEHSLKLSREYKDKKEESHSLNSLANLLQKLGDLSDALKYYLESLTLQKFLDDQKGLSTTINNLGTVYQKLENYSEALRYYTEALNLKTEEDLAGRATCLVNLGSVASIQKNFQEALKYHNEALKLRRQLNDRSGEANSLNNISLALLRLGDPEAALANCMSALTIRREIGDRLGEGASLSNLAAIYSMENDTTKAKKYLEDAIHTFDQITVELTVSEWRVALREMYISALERLCYLLFQENNLTSALGWIEIGKAREILGALETGCIRCDKRVELVDLINAQKTLIKSLEVEKKKLLDQSPLMSSKELAEKIQDLAKKQSRAYDQIREFNHIIWQACPDSGVAIPDDPVQFVSRFFRNMPKTENWALIQFFWHKATNELYTFLLTRHKQLLAKKIISSKKWKLMNQFAGAISDQIRKREVATAEKLLAGFAPKFYQWTIPEEIDQFLKTQSHDYLIVIPDRNTNSFPYEVFFDGEDYWGLKYKLSVSLSLNILRMNLENPLESSSPSLVVVGDPNYDQLLSTAHVFGTGEDHSFDASLSGAYKEAQVIGDLLKSKGKVSSFLREGATKKKFIDHLDTDTPAIIHFAGHALFDIRDPDHSFLLFRDGEVLTANEISSKICLTKNPLVILSACETGQATVTASGEAFGLVRGFMLSGCSSLLMSGWQVFDDSTMDFMIQLYEKFLNGVDIATTIRDARKTIQKNVQNQKYQSKTEILQWASFRLIGSPFIRFEPLTSK